MGVDGSGIAERNGGFAALNEADRVSGRGAEIVIDDQRIAPGERDGGSPGELFPRKGMHDEDPGSPEGGILLGKDDPADDIAEAHGSGRIVDDADDDVAQGGTGIADGFPGRPEGGILLGKDDPADDIAEAHGSGRIVDDADDDVAQGGTGIADVFPGGGAVGGENDALVLAGSMRIKGEDGGALVAALLVERLADDHPASKHARMAHGRDDDTINTGVDHGASADARIAGHHAAATSSLPGRSAG